MTPTELLQLHIDNDQDTYKYWQDKALIILQTTSDVEVWTDDQFYRFTLADLIKDRYTQDAPTIPLPYSDLMTYALGEVDFNNIAESVLETAKEGL